MTLDQSQKIAELIAVGWVRAPSRHALADHKLGEPVMMVRDLVFILVAPSGQLREPTAQEIQEW